MNYQYIAGYTQRDFDGDEIRLLLVYSLFYAPVLVLVISKRSIVLSKSELSG